MKRTLFGIIALLTLMMACSKDEEPAPGITPKFKVVISAEAGGTVSTAGGSYERGAKVTVTATPEGEFLFERWSDGNTDNPREIIVTADLSLSAHFIKKKYVLSISVEGSGSVDQEVIVQGSVSTAEYNSGTTIKLTANADSGWVFKQWTGDLTSSDNPISINLTGDVAISAQFEESQTGYVFDITGEGLVEIQSTSTGKFKLISKAADGWILDYWSGNFGTSDHEVLLVNQGDDEIVNVVFREISPTAQVFGEDNISAFYESLKTLSEGWNSAEVDKANGFLNQFSSVDADLWFLLFDQYLETKFFNENLWNYMIYPAFYWLGDEVNEKVQNGLSRAILKKLVVSSIETEDEKEQAFQILRALGEHLISVRDGRNKFEPNLLSSFLYYQEIFIKSYDGLFTYSYRLAGQQIADYGDIKAQLYYNLSGLSYYLDLPSSSITELIGLEGGLIEYEIFDRFSVLVYHNQFFTTESLNVIKDVFEMIPWESHKVIGITQQGAISNPHQLNSIGGFNLFELNTGIQKENGFPDEVTPFYSDLFYIVLIHELTHNVDFRLISSDTVLKTHRDHLIEMAGVAKENYLRSVIDSGYFIDNPQEFLASIANMFLTNTALTFEVALKRASNDNFHPLNQFLFFARVFGSEEAIHFYHFGENGPLLIESVPFEKNDSGFITRFVLEGKEYRFNLDQNNTVIDYEVSEL